MQTEELEMWSGRHVAVILRLKDRFFANFDQNVKLPTN